ncbi:LysR family transcriptional regulator [Uliginosibacterium sp. 31-12]|uniref:LysR family transcriptional regulator n=1 Tax=Uliginosibacterium sp. 31-12 TaxID=3062781 RepID=UPI0026E2AC42|nr:LysR family transcriptional regulator [Uliginosibacterium sp. 31-12]MDO6386633.1 LysR family transcriptional regulator [Uliginosibacterium sp. 31-12]
MNASFRQLKLFLAVAEQRSITAAARVCHVTQPSVSMQLKELTESVGLPLYEMVGKRLDLTPAGEALAETARAMVEEWARFEQQVDAMKGLTRGRLRVAVVSTAKYFVPRILGTFCQRYPEIDIEFEVQNRDGVVANLRANRNDLYIMSIPPEDIDIERHPFLPNPLVVIAPLAHPLAKRRRLALTDLADERFILRERGSGTRTSCDTHFRSAGFSPRVRLELGSNEAIKQAVAGGLGLSVLSQHALSPHLENDQLVVLPVSGFPVRCSWWILYPRGKRLSPIAQEFLRHLEASAEELRERFPVQT